MPKPTRIRKKGYSKYDKNKGKTGGFLPPPTFLLAFIASFSFGYYSMQYVSNQVEDAIQKSDAVLTSSLVESVKTDAEKALQPPPKPGEKIDHGNKKFLIFHKLVEAQGAGNQMHGLLAGKNNLTFLNLS